MIIYITLIHIILIYIIQLSKQQNPFLLHPLFTAAFIPPLYHLQKFHKHSIFS
ncbi:hypothetical protein HanIR_Chr15g0778381 [Helianthus annuus]|uniref:Uncharacterized protein n=1 Tax=Helianthus annuus TaxID=4232 RepID=A0A251SC77_HELAN|nr:hypothetical protein HanIR_Chr15g0778381 [Helianthus annuus]